MIVLTSPKFLHERTEIARLHCERSIWILEVSKCFKNRVVVKLSHELPGGELRGFQQKRIPQELR